MGIFVWAEVEIWGWLESHESQDHFPTLIIHDAHIKLRHKLHFPTSSISPPYNMVINNTSKNEREANKQSSQPPQLYK